ncbi:hydrogen gas-evolving membrane-bound hydrogenase subunit E [Deinococcus sp. Marseille-Q6407]|uniref:hydrogen gas-evolving membrane-bound hydrogenase subunit E n=1 Tax=Deinococcus sp. Marseille-Q6407 TaxID=2969223 RepID=UPI0021BE66EA|nr:hydrogen gas-evolving membrane-bound hydrogenase subunit E [Deinococcus sp. Marseille-Q6407]
MILAVFFPFVMAAVVAWAGLRLGRRTGYLAALGFVPALLLALPLAGMPGAAPLREAISWVPSLGLELGFQGDGFSLLFSVLIGTIGTLATLYSVSYLSSNERFARFYAYLLLFGGSMLGLVLSDNLIGLFGFWEMTSITSFLLIGLWHARAAARDGAIKAFLVSALGGLALLAAVAIIGTAGGSYNLSEINLAALQASPLFIPAMLLTLLAAFTKSAQLPFHLWLPTAMEAPTPVSAFLHSATMVKAGVFLVAKFGLLFGGHPLWAGIIVPVGLATMTWGSYLAMRQTDLKALLAFSTISQLGLLMSLYGLADAEGRFAGTAHLLNHAAFKAALFFVVGIVDHETGTREIPQLGGLRQVFPITFVLAIVASLSMAGLPPLGGFISKELFFEAMIHHGLPFILVAVVGSALTIAYSIRFISVWFGELKHPGKERPERPSNAILAPAAVLVAAAVLFGLWPHSVEVLVDKVSAMLQFSGYRPHLSLWHGVTPALVATLVTWAIAAFVWWRRDEFARIQQRLTPSWNANTAYYGFKEWVDIVATAVVLRTQGLALPSQLRWTLTAAFALGGYALLRQVPPLHLEIQLSLGLLLIVTLLLAGAVGVSLSRNRLTSVVLMGLTGFGSSAAFLAFRAPDLALTQMVIETVTVILFLLAFRYMPGIRALARTRAQYVMDLVIALSAGVGIMAYLMSVHPGLAESIAPYYLQHAYTGGGGKNVVNVTLVDFRGFDTMGEITVVGMVALTVLALLRLGKPGHAQTEYDTADPTANMALIPTRQEREHIREQLIESGTLSAPQTLRSRRASRKRQQQKKQTRPARKGGQK